MSQLKEFCDHCAKKHGTSNSFIGLAKPGQIVNVFCAGCGVTSVDLHGHCLKCKPNLNTKFLILMTCAIVVINIILFIMIAK